MSARLGSATIQIQSLERFVDANTAAEFLGITRRTLLQKVRIGKIPGHALDPEAQEKRVEIQTLGARPAPVF